MTADRTVDVLLITMPFGPLLKPSLGLSLLKTALGEQGISARVLYFTLDFAERIGKQDYLKIADSYQGAILGEWLFAPTLFKLSEEDKEAYINDVLRSQHEAYYFRGKYPEEQIARFREIQDACEPFMQACMEKVATYKFAVVGFTSVFYQHVASLALAQRIKNQYPDAYVVLGGANCESVMGAETLRQFSFIDAVVSGEGEVIFPKLVQAVLQNRRSTIRTLPGVYSREGTRLFGFNGHYPSAPKVRDMDELPYPDYDDFFNQYEEAAFEKPTKGGWLLFETSRGCWWGEKHHCTFCGLNGASLTFRSKSAERAIAELEYILDLYPHWRIAVVDNILDMRYFNTFIPMLTAKGWDLDLFYEVKANLQKRHIQQLRAAGIRSIQPGIESLSTPVLKLMNKGVTALQNIQLLKWCKEYGIKPFWNILWGFPGESKEAYEEMAQLVPLLTHLHPPEGVGPVHLHRFSPNFDFAEQYGFRNVQPFPAYFYVYRDLPRQAVANMAYYFTFNYQDDRNVDTYTTPVKEAINDWKKVYLHSDLFSIEKGEQLIICDLRPSSESPLVILGGQAKRLYQMCDQIQSFTRLRSKIQLPPDLLQRLLAQMTERGLMVHEDGKYLSLAIPVGVYQPTKEVLSRFRELLQEQSSDRSIYRVKPFAIDA